MLYTRHNISDLSAGEEILYGTTDGKIGLVQIGEDSAATKWEIENDKKKGGVLFTREYQGFACVSQLNKEVRFMQPFLTP